eukprot:gene17594-24442_t
MFNIFCAATLICTAIAYALDPTGYRLEEKMIPMRDGVELHTVIFFPRKHNSNKFPTIIDRSPYGYEHLEWFVDLVVPFSYVGIGQDVRGTEKSQGNFTMWATDKNDSQDLGDWIVSQEWSNGKVMTVGASADGIGSFQTLFNNPKWLSAQYVIWATPQMYRVLFPYGTYKQKTTEDWLMGVSMPNPD